jgi:hypothetical protein
MNTSSQPLSNELVDAQRLLGIVALALAVGIVMWLIAAQGDRLARILRLWLDVSELELLNRLRKHFAPLPPREKVGFV